MDLEELLRQYLQLSVGLDDSARDPLKRFRWASSAQARVWRWLCEGHEVLARFGNVAGKTSGVAAGIVAVCRGIRKLDDQQLPNVRVPCIVWVLTKTRRQQVDSVQAEYVRWLGGVPHEIAWDNRAKGYIDSIWIATQWCSHGTGTHCSSCSRVVFHCEQSGIYTFLGGRVDIIHADEPPSELIWREARSRLRAGSQLLLVISATPLYRKEWEWMARDFTDCEDRPRVGRVEVRSSLYENVYLTPYDRATLLRRWTNDPLFDARETGKYIDASGLCPFPSALLNRWDDFTRPPDRTLWVKIEDERDTANGLVLRHTKVPVEQWWVPEARESYWILVDPSTGIEDEKHDPAGLHVYARRRPRLVARYDGFTRAHGMGVLAAKLGRYYNRAMVDVEVTGGWGRGTLSALRTAKYPHVNRRQVELEPGRYGWKQGWDTTAPARAEMMAAVQRALEENSIVMPSRAVVSTLRGIIVDAAGKYLAAPGRHDEDLILLGRAMVLMADRRYYSPAEPTRAAGMRAAIRKELGQDPGLDDDAPRPRLRTRGR